MSAICSSSPRKRKAADCLDEASARTRHKQDILQDVNTTSEAINDDRSSNEDLSELRRIVGLLFRALETTLLSCTSASSFHSVQAAVASTAKCNFELKDFANIVGVWPGGYVLDRVMALVDGMRSPSISISVSQQGERHVTSSQRRETFAKRLESWDGTPGKLPVPKDLAHFPINTAKIDSIKKPKVQQPDASNSMVDRSTSMPSAKDRQSALLERIKAKAKAKETEAGPQDLKSATIAALVPNAVASIKILLASKKQKAMGMMELSDNLATSLSHRISRRDVEQLIELLAERYSHWCKIGTIRDVKLVRFIGQVPSVTTI